MNRTEYLTKEFDSILKDIREEKYIDEDSDRIKKLKPETKLLLKPIFWQQRIDKECEKILELLDIIMDELNIIDTKFPHPCRICGHEFATATKSWKCPTHFAKLRCSNCNAWFQWISEEDFKSRTTKYTRKLNNLGEFDDINDALGI
tara:strand:- start:45 stop:485 length:441 start_codon:yes stop_codon:yes gene_type:complete